VLRALAIGISMALNLMLWGTLVLLGGLFKLLTFGETRRRIILFLARLADHWVAGNARIFDTFLDTRWEITGLEQLNPDTHYLVIANHVSWVDIFALFRAFHGRTPFPRFFLKQVLIWFPIAGQACWALEFPFMHRYSPEYLAQHPEKRGKDLETTLRFCQRYRRIPVAILNFVEGTRFSRQKHEDQQSPYRYLLRPRIGGISFVLAALGDQVEKLIDITLVYPRRDVTMWDFVTNRLPWIRVHGRLLDIPKAFSQPAVTEPGPTREQLKAWAEQIWREKDAEIGKLLGRA
jgi:1-acyl-sn-glycerol-3-phosphate acyltransferase